MRSVVFVAIAWLCMLTVVCAQDKPRVFITDSNSWSVRSGAVGADGGFGGAGTGGARPQTAEIIKTFGQRCPQAVVNDQVKRSDYVVELDHEGGKGLFQHKDKIAVFVRSTGDSIFSKSTLSVGGSVQDACAAILNHWTAHEQELRVADVPATVAGSQVAAYSASLTISSTPAGADIQIDGSYMGSTPSTIQLKPGEHEVVVSKKGYQAWQRKLDVTGGTINIEADLVSIPAS